MRVRDEHGMVGKLIVVWLLMMVLIGVAAIDTASVLFARFRLSDAATVAASTGSAALTQGQSSADVCAAAAARVEEKSPDARMPRRSWCKVDATAAEVTITLRIQAGTLLAGRLPFTEDLTFVSARETVGRSAL